MTLKMVYIPVARVLDVVAFDIRPLYLLFVVGCISLALAWGIHVGRTIYSWRKVLVFVTVDLVMIILYFMKFC